MYEIRHRIGVEASLGAVYEHIATTEGLRQWWTTDVRGQSAVRRQGVVPLRRDRVHDDGGRRARHGSPRRRCIDGPEEWIDTVVSFDIRDVAGETILNFVHAGWREPVEFMGHCSSKWGSTC